MRDENRKCEEERGGWKNMRDENRKCEEEIGRAREKERRREIMRE